ncbi:MAG: hypothetical protein JWO47_476 [Candidatus Saccharibacteria bacterium]|nr:hypothetical protein [Candidatus Saccharibacteria bacterium]
MNHALETVPLVGPQEEEAYAKWFAKDIPTMVQAGLERPLLKRTDWAELSRIGDPAAYIVGVFERKRPEVLNPRNTSAMKAAFTAYSVFAGGIHKYRNFEDV